jgi:hypothetical protein
VPSVGDERGLHAQGWIVARRESFAERAEMRDELQRQNDVVGKIVAPAASRLLFRGAPDQKDFRRQIAMRPPKPPRP